MNFRLRHSSALTLLLFLSGAALASADPAAEVAVISDTAAAKTATTREKLTTAKLDELVARNGVPLAAAADDALFLRRVSFDLIGRPPTLAEQRQFAEDVSATKRGELIERLLASEEFGANWANYWCDVIAYRVPPPELTYLNYTPFKGWLTKHLTANTPWDVIVRELLTAQGKIDEQPAATFVGYHQADPTNLAGETSRLFLGQLIGCAQCHDHPFDHWKRQQFHELAAFFARSKAKLSQNDGGGTIVSAADKGEYLMPNLANPREKGLKMLPGVLDGTELKFVATSATNDTVVDKFDKDVKEKSPSDQERRAQLAAWVTSPENPWFAKAYVNRIWARMLGRGFYEPVDDMGDSQKPQWPEIHAALAEHFVASGYDMRDLFRLIANSEAYRRGPQAENQATPARLRGDEVFAALAAGIGLPNVTPPAIKPTGAVRFPPPPKSTRDLVNDAFGTDPSFAPVDAPRTMAQALWMMNNEQLQKQLSSKPDSGTMLAKLLADESDNQRACEQLYQHVLARPPQPAELKVALEHIQMLKDRGAAFEDLLWSLLNSTEFTTRR